MFWYIVFALHVALFNCWSQIESFKLDYKESTCIGYQNPAVHNMLTKFVVKNGQNVPLPPMSISRYESANIISWGINAVIDQMPSDKHVDKYLSWIKYLQLREKLQLHLNGYVIQLHIAQLI